MNPTQLAQQIKATLESLRWTHGSKDLVFGATGNVAVVAGQPLDSRLPPGMPCALVSVEGGQFDEADPATMEARLRVFVLQEVAGDRMGEHSVIGGAQSDPGRSAGKGVGEILAACVMALKDLTGADGAQVQLSGSTMGSPAPIGESRVVMQEFEIAAVCTSEAHYAAPQRLRYEVEPVWRWKWDGAHCASRFDFLQYRMVRKHGTTPSIDPTDGTVVYTGTAPQFLTTTEHASGYVYTVFADYNARGGSAVEGSSLPEVGAWRAP